MDDERYLRRHPSYNPDRRVESEATQQGRRSQRHREAWTRRNHEQQRFQQTDHYHRRSRNTPSSHPRRINYELDRMTEICPGCRAFRLREQEPLRQGNNCDHRVYERCQVKCMQCIREDFLRRQEEEQREEVRLAEIALREEEERLARENEGANAREEWGREYQD